MKNIFVKKQGMTQIFDDDGRVNPGTVVEILPMVVVEHKKESRDGYSALVVAFEPCREKCVNKPRLGQIKDLAEKGKSFRNLREILLSEDQLANWPVGKEITGEIFTAGDNIMISGLAKGKGFQGVVKRHGFAGGPRTHGQKHSEREGGSIGTSGVQRVLKGKRMPGRTGGQRVTIKNLKIVRVNNEGQEMFIRGSIPGRRGTLLEIKAV